MNRKKEFPPVPLRSDDPASDQVISDLMAKRRLQQEALLKIMTAMEKESSQEETKPINPVKALDKLGRKIFNTPKKRNS